MHIANVYRGGAMRRGTPSVKYAARSVIPHFLFLTSFFKPQPKFLNAAIECSEYAAESPRFSLMWDCRILTQIIQHQLLYLADLQWTRGNFTSWNLPVISSQKCSLPFQPITMAAVLGFSLLSQRKLGYFHGWGRLSSFCCIGLCRSQFSCLWIWWVCSILPKKFDILPCCCHNCKLHIASYIGLAQNRTRKREPIECKYFNNLGRDILYC